MLPIKRLWAGRLQKMGCPRKNRRIAHGRRYDALARVRESACNAAGDYFRRTFN